MLVARESVSKTRSAGLVRDLRLFNKFTRRVRPANRPPVSDEPCATEFANNLATQRSPVTDGLWARLVYWEFLS